MKRGDIFKHKIWMDTNNNNLTCIVTKVLKGKIYWKETGAAKSKYFFWEDEIDYYVLYIEN